MRRRAAPGVAAAVILVAVVAVPLRQQTVTHNPDPPAAPAQAGSLGNPAFMVVCQGPTTPACATAAAGRAHRTVAWLPATSRATATTLVAVAARRSWANQDLTGPNLVASLSSPGLGRPPGTVVATVRERDTVLEVRAGPGRALALGWTRAGRPFRLTATPRSGALQLSRLLGLWRAVRYATPPPSADLSP
jgi:hypothetical protein